MVSKVEVQSAFFLPEFIQKMGKIFFHGKLFSQNSILFGDIGVCFAVAVKPLKIGSVVGTKNFAFRKGGFRT